MLNIDQICGWLESSRCWVLYGYFYVLCCHVKKYTPVGLNVKGFFSGDKKPFYLRVLVFEILEKKTISKSTLIKASCARKGLLSPAPILTHCSCAFGSIVTHCVQSTGFRSPIEPEYSKSNPTQWICCSSPSQWVQTHWVL